MRSESRLHILYRPLFCAVVHPLMTAFRVMARSYPTTAGNRLEAALRRVYPLRREHSLRPPRILAGVAGVQVPQRTQQMKALRQAGGVHLHN